MVKDGIITMAIGGRFEFDEGFGGVGAWGEGRFGLFETLLLLFAVITIIIFIFIVSHFFRKVPLLIRFHFQCKIPLCRSFGFATWLLLLLGLLIIIGWVLKSWGGCCGWFLWWWWCLWWWLWWWWRTIFTIFTNTITPKLHHILSKHHSPPHLPFPLSKFSLFLCTSQSLFFSLALFGHFGFKFDPLPF